VRPGCIDTIVLVYADLTVDYTISVEPGNVEYFVMVLGASMSVEICEGLSA
jgi:hypothetical protein